MKEILTIFLATLSVGLFAKSYNPNTLPVDLNQITYSRVINPDEILSQETIAGIDTLLISLQRSTQVQALVIVVKNIEDDNPFEFSLAVGNKYGVGNKESKGFVLTLATDDRSYFLLTGDGLEGALPDAICKRIENRVMVPRLKEGDWDSAMLQTVSAIKEYIEGNKDMVAMMNKDDDDWTDEDQETLIALIVGSLLFGGIFIGATIYDERKKRYCSVCKRHKMRMLRRVTNKLNRKVECVETWQCQNCGHTETRRYIRQDSNGFDGGFYGGGLGGFGGSSSSGSFGGFGGGHFSGGGAGGRF